MSSPTRAAVPLLLLLALDACDTPGVTLLYYPEDSGNSESGLLVLAALEDSTLAATLGWSHGVPGATVIIQRVGEPFAPDSFTTDSLGRLRLTDILPGQVHIAAHRVLKDDEAGPTGGIIRAFGDGWTRDVGREGTLRLDLVADNAGSIVFSEWYPGSTVEYGYGGYIELYNNGDTTVYLDGMLLGHAWPVVGETPEYPCSETESWRNDPLGIWSKEMHKFPGSGHEHPIAPGQAVTVALDAVDHSVADAELPDLSHVDFEMEGTADTDNPDVPNLPFLGLTANYMGHGTFVGGDAAFFLASPVEFESLTRRRSLRYEYVRVPTEVLVDVVDMHNGANYRVERLDRPCGLSVPRSLERLKGGFLDSREHLALAVHRRILRTRAQGRIVLQDVNTSFVDFVWGPRSPGRIDY